MFFENNRDRFYPVSIIFKGQNPVAMMSAAPLCSRVSDGLHCPACKRSSCIVKNGSTKTGK